MEKMSLIASLVMAMIINGTDGVSGGSSMKLWGLVVCHHTSPHAVPFPLCYACELLMQALSLQLNMELQLADQLIKKHILRTQTLLCDMLLRDVPIRIVTQSPSIMDLVKCDDTTMYYGGIFWPKHNSSGLVNGWNAKVAELTGLPVGEVMGKPLVHDLVFAEFVETIEKLRGEEEKNVEIKLRTFGSQRKKNVVFLVGNAYPNRDYTDNIVGVCFVGEDVTGQKVVMDKFIRTQGAYMAIVQSPNPLIPPIFASDEYTCYLEWNATMDKLTVQEGLEIDKDALKLIASKSNGSLRDVEMTLDQLSLLGQRISLPLGQELVGLIPDKNLVDLLDLALSADIVNAVKCLRELMEARKHYLKKRWRDCGKP
eukprot:Gb_32578 [translate_table: standard]